jgi:hypothetical protein
MNPSDPNVALLEVVAAGLGDALCEDMVFVGGAVAGLLISDQAMPDIRPTFDVDLICNALVREQYYRVEARLRERGFAQDTRTGAPICRWRLGEVAVDVMPPVEEVLGFTNRWYPLALQDAQTLPLPSGRLIKVLTAPLFIATKLEAFDGRGNGDFLASHDLEDLLTVVDGRPELLRECRACPDELRAYLGERFSALLAARAFKDALPGHLPSDVASQERLPALLARLQELASLR